MPRVPFRLPVRFAVVGSACLLAACATQPEGPIPSVNAAAGVALKGYDPVAYFVAGQPVEGSDRFQTVWQGVTYRFASTEDRDKFAADPEKYAPQYGGFCAFAAANDRIADIDPGDWAVVDGKLYLNNNDIAQALWSVDKSGNIVAGDRFWAAVAKQPAQP
jgi:YHS domain-containing protein